ncbi:hypothetical protein E2C01_018169 [Portunus trituberculatus]|uniref:Uncharacterized protein n=1 Tax=Portunus trituberculatus TaxID=210409 RepID=A0A5B7DUC3_PORTR|nr:hypothetical protein [Portunus trituberculatus]
MRSWKTSLLRTLIIVGRNKPRIIQGGVVGKDLREEFSFIDRRDGSGAIKMK